MYELLGLLRWHATVEFYVGLLEHYKLCV